MRINKNYLESLNPCRNRYKNFLEHYPNFDGSLSEFLDLENISYHDKLWVYFRSIPRESIMPIVTEFAEQVIYIYKKYNKDTSLLKEAIICAKENDKKNAERLYLAVCNAAFNARDDVYAQRAAYAVANAVHVTCDNIYAKTAAINSVVYSLVSIRDINNRRKLEKKQIKILKKYLLKGAKHEFI